MDDIFDIIGEAATPAVEIIKDWGQDALDGIKKHAPQYLRYVIYALKGLHI
ncbi:MAG: hypothetical protein IJR13_09615 [Bacteroidales bacterium]|nr:hypothetical protein [Bacteroidales bacterium]